MLLALAGCALLLTGCSGDAPPEQDRHALEQLRVIAARDAAASGETGEVRCWLPSQHMIDERQWRVICRVHYEQGDVQRHRDMICIGDSEQDPVTDYCYPWVPYSDMPAFEDHPAYSA